MSRICVEDKKTDRSAISKGKVPNGICLRDISELRLGFDAFNFKNIDTSKKEQDCCFSIIGTERSLSMSTPTKVMMPPLTIDWSPIVKDLLSTLCNIHLTICVFVNSIPGINSLSICRW